MEHKGMDVKGWACGKNQAALGPAGSAFVGRVQVATNGIRRCIPALSEKATRRDRRTGSPPSTPPPSAVDLPLPHPHICTSNLFIESPLVCLSSVLTSSRRGETGRRRWH